MSEKKLTVDEKRYAFDFIMANALNDKLTNEEFRALLVDTWAKKVERANAPQSSTHDDKQAADKQTKEKVELYLEHGSLLVMKDTTQSYWLHRLPPTKKVSTARINLTFRTIVE